MSEKRVFNMYHNETAKWAEGNDRYCLHVLVDDDPLDPRTQYDHNSTMACFHRRYTLGDEINTKDCDEFWRELVRENVDGHEIEEAVTEGRLSGIRVEKSEHEEETYNLYETGYVNGKACDMKLVERNVEMRFLVEDILDILTPIQCMTLLRPHAEFIPLWLYDHSGISMSCGDRTYPYNDSWDSGCVGWIITMKKDAISSGLTEENWRAKSRKIMEAEVQEYDSFLTGEVFGYTLYEEEDGEWHEIDSCWGFYGTDILENGIEDRLGTGFYKALIEGKVRKSEARKRTKVYYEF